MLVLDLVEDEDQAAFLVLPFLDERIDLLAHVALDLGLQLAQALELHLEDAGDLLGDVAGMKPCLFSICSSDSSRAASSSFQEPRLGGHFRLGFCLAGIFLGEVVTPAITTDRAADVASWLTSAPAKNQQNE